MPDTPIVYDDVEVLEQDGLGLVCRIGNERVFIGKYVPATGTTVHTKGDRGRLTLPRWFVEQQGLPVSRHLADDEIARWVDHAKQRAASAQEYAGAHPHDERAIEALNRAIAELSGAILIRARRFRPR